MQYQSGLSLVPCLQQHSSRHCLVISEESRAKFLFYRFILRLWKSLAIPGPGWKDLGLILEKKSSIEIEIDRTSKFLVAEYNRLKCGQEPRRNGRVIHQLSEHWCKIKAGFFKSLRFYQGIIFQSLPLARWWVTPIHTHRKSETVAYLNGEGWVWARIGHVTASCFSRWKHIMTIVAGEM